MTWGSWFDSGSRPPEPVEVAPLPPPPALPRECAPRLYPISGGRWFGVLEIVGHTDGRRELRRMIADCPTREAADAALRLLSGAALTGGLPVFGAGGAVLGVTVPVSRPRQGSEGGGF